MNVILKNLCIGSQQNKKYFFSELDCFCNILVFLDDRYS